MRLRFADHFTIQKSLYNTIMKMPDLYPMILSPTVKNYIWGGQKLLHLIDKEKSENQQNIAEIWAIYGKNVIQNGAFAGRSLESLLFDRSEELLGLNLARKTKNGFPLLIKILDSQQWLSIQVHPDDEQAISLEGPQFNGKTEAWFCLDSEAGSKIYAGVKDNVTPADLVNAIKNNSILDSIQLHEFMKNDYILLESGVIHALGPGLLIYELQQSSDITYRVFDWNRPASDGRPLHIEKSCLAAKNIQTFPRHLSGKRLSNSFETLVNCEYFRLVIVNNSDGIVDMDTKTQSFHALTVISGQMLLQSRDSLFSLKEHESIIIPASLGKYQLSGEFSVLKASTD